MPVRIEGGQLYGRELVKGTESTSENTRGPKNQRKRAQYRFDDFMSFSILSTIWTIDRKVRVFLSHLFFPTRFLLTLFLTLSPVNITLVSRQLTLDRFYRFPSFAITVLLTLLILFLRFVEPFPLVQILSLSRPLVLPRHWHWKHREWHRGCIVRIFGKTGDIFRLLHWGTHAWTSMRKDMYHACENETIEWWYLAEVSDAFSYFWIRLTMRSINLILKIIVYYYRFEMLESWNFWNFWKFAGIWNSNLYQIFSYPFHNVYKNVHECHSHSCFTIDYVLYVLFRRNRILTTDSAW